MNFESVIKREANEIATRHRVIHDSWKNRGKDPETWRMSCERFHSYESNLCYFLSRIFSKRVIKDQQAIEFAISYLEVDPFYFRSGYIKEDILTRLKRSEVTKKQTNRLKKVIIKVITKGHSRELPYYYRLACKITTPEFIEQILEISDQTGDKYLKQRINRMLYTIKHST